MNNYRGISLIQYYITV